MIAAAILLVIGGFMLLFTHTAIRFQIWTQRVVVGAQYIPSKRTYTVLRILGIFLIVVGIIIAVVRSSHV